MILVRSDVKGHFLPVICLQEPGQLSVLSLRNVFEEKLRTVLIIVQDGRLVVHHRQQEVVDDDLKVLVDKIKSVGLGVIAEEELFLVCVGQLHNLLSNQVENTSLDVGEDEAILADPETGGNDVREFLHKVEALLAAIIIVVWVGIRVTRGDVLAHCLRVVIEEVILILKSKDDLLTVL